MPEHHYLLCYAFCSRDGDRKGLKGSPGYRAPLGSTRGMPPCLYTLGHYLACTRFNYLGDLSTTLPRCRFPR